MTEPVRTLPREKPCPICRGRYPEMDACLTCEGDGTVELELVEDTQDHPAE